VEPEIERTPAIADVRALFLEYAESLSFPLDFQGFEQELASLPGPYAPPDGALLVAAVDGAPAGCVAYRRLDGATCEMKRLYVRPPFRGHGLGRRLTLELIATAREQGYTFMRLDTTPEMAAAQELYRSLGFRSIGPYRPNQIAGARFLELEVGG